MKRLAGIFIGGLALCQAATADTVFTRDGRIHRGKISLGTNLTVRIVSPGATNTVATTNLLRAVFGATASKPGLSHVTFKLYQGNWQTIPDFSQLPIAQNGSLITNRLDLTPLGPESGARRLFDLKPNTVLKRWASPRVAGRPFSVSATVNATAGEGVILAHGGHLDGYALYLEGGHLTFAIRVNHKLEVVRDPKPFPLNQKVNVTARLRRDATLELAVDGRPPAKMASPSLMVRQPLDGLSVGADTGVRVGPYKNENPFRGTLTNVRVTLTGVALVYTGNLQVTTAGPYQFSLAADAATRLTIDGRVVIDNSDPAKPTVPWGTAELVLGAHEFQLTYAQLLFAKGAPIATTAPRVVATTDQVWIEDSLPEGVVFTQGKMEWASAPEPVHGGAKSLKVSGKKTGLFYFNSGVRNPNRHSPLTPAQDDLLYAYVYPDPKDPPEQILMQWHDSRGWEHRAYWGQNLHHPGVGAHGTVRLWPMGPLPAAGKWTRLEVPVLAVGFAPGSPWPTIHGWGFMVNGGTAYWDQCGLARPIVVKSGDDKHLSLNWFGPGAIDHALSAVPHPTAKTWRLNDKAVPAAGYLTWNGSFIPKPVTKVDAEKIHFANFSLARGDVSTLILRPLSFLQANRLNEKIPGVLLMNGDLIGGRLRSLDENEIVISSVQFGLKKYKPIEEAVAVILKPATKAIVRHHFKLRDGSLIFTKKFEVQGAQIILADAPFKGRAIPFAQIAEMTYGRVPNLLQGSADHLASLSGPGRQQLEALDKSQLLVVQQYGEWAARLKNAETVMAAAKRDLPALAKSEAEALADQAKALAARNAARQKVTANIQAHNQTTTALTTARAKLEADCLKMEQAGQALVQLISSRHDPARQKLTAAQQQAAAIAAAQAVNQRDLAAAQTANAQATLARQAAEAAAQATATALTAAQAKLATAQAAQTATGNDFQARQKAAADAHTASTNVLSTQFAPALGGLAAAHKALAQALQDQASADAKVLQLNTEVQTATANSEATAAAAQAVVTDATAAAARAATTMTALNTAKATLTNATSATATARQTLETLQTNELNPALAKAKAANLAVTAATREKARADQSLVTVKNVAAKAMKTAAEAAKLAQTKFEPEQVKKDLAATQTLAQQLRVLAQAAQARIDEVIAGRQQPAQAALIVAVKSLAQTRAQKKAASLALATLKESLGKAATAHANVDQAAVTAKTKAQVALTAHTIATNFIATAVKDFEAKQTATGAARKTMAGKFATQQLAAQSIAAAAANNLQANLIKTEAVRAAAIAKANLATTTTESTAAAEAASIATTSAATARARATTVKSRWSPAKSVANTKKTAANKSLKALESLAPRQSAAHAKAALTNREFIRAETALAAAAQSFATATGQVERAKANLKTIEQAAKATRDSDEAAALKKQIAEAKQTLNRLVKVVQKQATAKVAAAASARTKANTAKDTADRALTAMNARVVTATAAARLADAELDVAAGALIAAQSKLDEAMVVQQLAEARFAAAQAAAAEANHKFTEATAADQAATALAVTAATAVTKAGTDQAAAAKAWTTAIQQATVAIMGHRAALKVQGGSEATVKLTEKKIDKAATSLADSQEFARQQRGFADQAKQALDALSGVQQKKAMAHVTVATAAITQAQADMKAASEILKPIEAELAMLVQTVLLVEQAEAVVLAIMKTLKAKAVLGAKLTAEKKLLMELTRKAAESFVAVNLKRAMDHVTAAGTDLTETKADQAAAAKESMTIKLKTADATTVFLKAGQAQRDAEAGVKMAGAALAKALEERAQSGMLAGEKAKLVADAKAGLADLTADQKLAVAASEKAKADLAKVTVVQVKASQTFNSANTVVVAMVLSRRTTGKAARESDEKATAARTISKMLAGELATLELQAAAWKDQTARVVGDLTRLTARWQTPATQKATRLNTAFTQAVTARAAGEQALAAANAAVTARELSRRTAIETGLASDSAELKAQQTEADAWRELVLAKRVAAKAEEDYKKSGEEYRDKKKKADTVRGKQSKAQQEATTSKAQLTRLKPAYEAIVRP